MLTVVETPDAPASSRILWALKLATKKDYRGLGLTQAEAVKTLAEANAKSGYQPKTNQVAVRLTTAAKASPLSKVTAPKSGKDSALAHIVANIDSLVHSICEEVDIVSVVKNDTNFLADDGKRFVMFGAGCGFAWISGYRKTAKNLALVQLIGGFHKITDELVIKALPDVVRKVLIANGSLYPILAQSKSYNEAFCWMQIKWLETQGVKGAHVLSRLD